MKKKLPPVWIDPEIVGEAVDLRPGSRGVVRAWPTALNGTVKYVPASAIREAVKRERERCAKICEALAIKYDSGAFFYIAAAAKIRKGGGA